MALFSKRTTMQKLQADLAALTARATLLNAKRTAAQLVFDRAVDAGERHMLEGDVEDEKISTKLHGAVDAADSLLNSFTKPIATLAVSIDIAQQALAIEQQTVARRGASETLATQVAAIESAFPAWLLATRAF